MTTLYTGPLRQAITTKFAGPTNSRGSRVIATAEAGRVTLDWDHALDVPDNHYAAAYALACKFGWLPDAGTRLIGGTKDGYVWVLA